MKLRALVDMDLRQSADPTSPDWEKWIHWSAGDEFEPPPHMMVDRALERGIAEKVEPQARKRGT